MAQPRDVATLSLKGQIVIPKRIRERLKLQPGSKVLFEDQNGSICLVPLPEDPVEALHGRLAGKSGTSILKEERRRERKKDEDLVRGLRRREE